MNENSVLIHLNVLIRCLFDTRGKNTLRILKE
jgi:hypothetical protein